MAIRKTATQTAENTQVNSRYDLSLSDMAELRAAGDICDMVYAAFKLGYCRGTRAEKARLKARAKREHSTT